MSTSKPKAWRTYEEVATFLLNQLSESFGLSRVEGDVSVAGATSGTKWKIDAKGTREGDAGFVMVEIRRNTTSRLTQEKLAALAYRIQDAGAVGGIVVSPLPLQTGAERIAKAANIVAVQLNERSTTTEYLLRFLNHVMMSLAPDTHTACATLTGVSLITVVEHDSPRSDGEV